MSEKQPINLTTNSKMNVQFKAKVTYRQGIYFLSKNVSINS